ncbi:hypothetical protein PIB30_028271 [Stylosanthes scabra]|uniref:Copper transporter n=1 Tax=Stylosanthes scabra TaxID=79078 RepID=A0ABU6W995_9FABA|nr:hypothetical protein [Stylosanthes scabra]
MVREYSKNGGDGWAPIGAPAAALKVHKMVDEDLAQHYWSNFDSSVNAVSFGFVATAILISMFLLMAIFERFLRPSSSSSSSTTTTTTRNRPHLHHSHLGFNSKLTHPSPKMSLYASWVSVMMPGDEIPTFIAHPAPAPCRRERILWPSHQHTTLHCSSSNTLASTRRES